MGASQSNGIVNAAWKHHDSEEWRKLYEQQVKQRHKKWSSEQENREPSGQYFLLLLLLCIIILAITFWLWCEENWRARRGHERVLKKLGKLEEEMAKMGEKIKTIMHGWEWEEGGVGVEDEDEDNGVEEEVLRNEANRPSIEEGQRKIEEMEKVEEERASMQKEMEKERAAIEKKIKKEIRLAQEQLRHLKEKTRLAQERQRQFEEEIKRIQGEKEKRQLEEAQKIVREKEDRKRREEEVRIAQEMAEEEREAREKADQETKRIQQELEESMKSLEMGIQPIVWPTDEERQSVKDKLGYRDKHFHFAVSGQARSGKSSLINAFRGMKNKDPEAAKTGVTETTQEITRYPDPDSQPPRAWFDIPGAGTLDISNWQYFNQQGLFIFDLVIVAVDIRLTAIDLSIIENCQRFGIPSFIVRSKADQHIRNIMGDLGYDSDDDEQDHRSLKRQAHNKFVSETRQSFESILKKSNLPLQKTYIVSNNNLWAVVKGKAPKSLIDERELMNDLLSAAKKGHWSQN